MRSDGLKEGFALDVRFHEYKGLKRVLSIIIVRKSGGRDEWKSKETGERRRRRRREGVDFNPSSSNRSSPGWFLLVG